MDEPDLWALFDHRPAATYYKGRVALLGDAAHASTPHQGAGAGQALEDAFIMATLLADDKVQTAADVVKAFAAYDAIRRPRSQKVVTTSRAAGELYAFKGPAGGDLDKIRDDLLTRCRWIWDEDMEQQAERAQAVLALESTDHSAAVVSHGPTATTTKATITTTTTTTTSSKKRASSGAYRNVFGMFRNWSTRLARIVQKA